MFTGIVKAIGRVERTETRKSERHFRISATLMGIKHGASIACDGVCLTVVEKGKGWFAVQASEETLLRTTLNSWKKGRLINLEKSLRSGDALDGHLVSGHVDGIGEIMSILLRGETREMRIKIPRHLKHFFAEKGSVAVNGVSLTVNAVENAVITVNIIPYTWVHTGFKMVKKGDLVNIEVDMLARYVARFLEGNS